MILIILEEIIIMFIKWDFVGLFIKPTEPYLLFIIQQLLYFNCLAFLSMLIMIFNIIYILYIYIIYIKLFVQNNSVIMTSGSFMD